MGFVFTVGAPSDVYEAAHAAKVTAALERRYQRRIPPTPLWRRVLPAVGRRMSVRSSEIAASWPEQLQRHLAERHDPNVIRHLASVDAWSSVFLPWELEPEALSLGSAGAGRVEGGDPATAALLQELLARQPDRDISLRCASLPALLPELDAVAGADLPTTEAACWQVLDERRSDDRLGDAPHLQAFAWLSIAARAASARGAALWLVK